MKGQRLLYMGGLATNLSSGGVGSILLVADCYHLLIVLFGVSMSQIKRQIIQPRADKHTAEIEEEEG